MSDFDTILFIGSFANINIKAIMNSFKSLIPSIILILIYFIADEFLGPVAGMACAFVLGTGEFIYVRLREKRNDRMILWTTLLFCIPGIVSLVVTGSILEKLQPIILETSMCILTGVFAFTQTDLTSTLPSSLRKTVQLTTGQQKMMRNTVKILFYILSAHTILTIISVFSLPPETASFIGNTLLYIVLGLFFTTLFIRNKVVARKYRQEEWLPIVNEQGEVQGQAPRSVCHSGSKLLHPVVHLHIVDENGNLFLQKRSMTKKLLPGKWDSAVGGHIGINEKIEDALKRETYEELGITDFEARFIGSYVWESSREKELVFSFCCNRYNQIDIHNDEVDEGRFWSAGEIINNQEKDIFTPNFIYEYKKYREQLLYK